MKGLAAAWVDGAQAAHPPSPTLPSPASWPPSTVSPSLTSWPSGPSASDASPSPSAPPPSSSAPSATHHFPSASDAALPQSCSPEDAAHAAGSLAASHLAQTRRSAEVTPLSPDRYRVQVTIGADTLEKLRLAKDLLRHAVPSGDEAVILDRALTALLEDLAQRRFAAAEKPRTSSGGTHGSRHIPAEVRRTVWVRDHGCCAFVGKNGRRCSDRGFLEFHHVQPYALGGEATVTNIQLRCRSHNAYEARLYFARGNANGGAGCRTGSERELRSCSPRDGPHSAGATCNSFQAESRVPPVAGPRSLNVRADTGAVGLIFPGVAGVARELERQSKATRRSSRPPAARAVRPRRLR